MTLSTKVLTALLLICLPGCGAFGPSPTDENGKDFQIFCILEKVCRQISTGIYIEELLGRKGPNWGTIILDRMEK